MLRGLSDALLLFLLPFAAYAVILKVQRRYPKTVRAFARGPMLRLAVGGLALAAAGLLAAGLFADRHRGGYVPAHVEDGVLVPGRMR